MDTVIDSKMISEVNKMESELTQQPSPVAKGPTAILQKHYGKNLNPAIVSEVTVSEKGLSNGKSSSNDTASIMEKTMERHRSIDTDSADVVLTGEIEHLKIVLDDVKTCLDNIAAACSRLEQEHSKTADLTNMTNSVASNGNSDKSQPTIDGSIVSKVLEAEKVMTQKSAPIKDGPTARAQKHIGSAFDTTKLRDISEGERLITGKPGVVKGGPTAVFQRELDRARTTNAARVTAEE